MRIIAGSHKGRKLLASEGSLIRPTSGRVKEALFSIIGNHISGSQVLDLYAGTGAVGIEALSRGAQRVAFVESHPDSIHLLRANLKRCDLLGRADVYACRAEDFLQPKSIPRLFFDIIFADPPYGQTCLHRLLPSIELSAMIHPQTLVLLEHPSKENAPSRCGRFDLIRSYQYGDTAVSKYRLQTTDCT